MNAGPRIEREKTTVERMIHMYCAAHHSSPLCNTCEELLQYAYKRLGLCVFGERKSTCGKCPIHCYKPHYKQQIKQVMRYAGPRMIVKHPVLAVHHLLDGLKPAPKHPKHSKPSRTQD